MSKDPKERAAEVLDEMKRAARGAPDTPEPNDQELLARAEQYVTRMRQADAAALVQTYAAFRVIVEAFVRRQAERHAAGLSADSDQVVADLRANPSGPEAAAMLWICRTLRAPTRQSTRDEIERWVECLAAMPSAEALAFVQDHPALRAPLIDALLRRFRYRIHDATLPAAARADAVELLMNLGMLPSPHRAQ